MCRTWDVLVIVTTTLMIAWLIWWFGFRSENKETIKFMNCVGLTGFVGSALFAVLLDNC